MTNLAPPARVAKFGLVFRGDPHAARPPVEPLGWMFEALARLGVTAESITYADDVIDDVRRRLLGCDGVLVWVNPIDDGRDRSSLDAVLRDVSAKGVWVSAHPDVILTMGTKEVLFKTREMGWGSDTHLYRSLDDLCAELPARLATGQRRILKQNRGNGGNGTWSVQLDRPTAGPKQPPALNAQVFVQHAVRDSPEEQISLGAFIGRCEPYFAGPNGLMVDQPYLQRLTDGMVRCYMVHDVVVGFSPQHPTGLLPPPAQTGERPAPPRRSYVGATEPAFQALKARMETEWLPELRRVLNIDADALPVIWDADFLYGPKTQGGDDTYVLCEINVSAVFPFPDEAVEQVAAAAVAAVSQRGTTHPKES